MTSYKALKETEAHPGDFVTIIGAAGGLGHLAIQYGNAMGLRVIAMDVGEDRLNYCKELGAEFCVDASNPEAVAVVRLPAALLSQLRDVNCNHVHCYNLILVDSKPFHYMRSKIFLFYNI